MQSPPSVLLFVPHFIDKKRLFHLDCFINMPRARAMWKKSRIMAFKLQFIDIGSRLRGRSMEITCSTGGFQPPAFFYALLVAGPPAIIFRTAVPQIRIRYAQGL